MLKVQKQRGWGWGWGDGGKPREHSGREWNGLEQMFLWPGLLPGSSPSVFGSCLIPREGPHTSGYTTVFCWFLCRRTKIEVTLKDKDSMIPVSSSRAQSIIHGAGVIHLKANVIHHPSIKSPQANQLDLSPIYLLGSFVLCFNLLAMLNCLCFILLPLGLLNLKR